MSTPYKPELSKIVASNLERPRSWSRTGLALLALGLGPSLLLGCSVETLSDEEPDAAQQDLKLPPGEVLTPVMKPWPFPRPFPPINPDELVSISAGIAHTCVLKRNGNVYCWGRDELGQAGQLPSATCASSPNNCVDCPRLVASSVLGPATQLDAGDHHTCVLNTAGAAFCWGHANHGQIGAGFTGSISEPIAVSGGLTFTSISAGTMGSCGTTADGAFCWGVPIPSGSQFVPDKLTPFRIYSSTGLAPTGISLGYMHVCAQWVSGAYRETNCWGRDWEGQTGSPFAPFTLLGQGPFGIGSDAARVTTQAMFTCVDQAGPSVACFGAGTSGQLGNGANANQASPQTIGGATPMALRGVSTGQYHACALDLNGAAYCWGYGSYGQLGNGLPPGGGPGTSSNVPTSVTGGRTYRAIAAGERHTCAIGTDNHIYCWGSNYHGELGTQYKSSGQPYTNGWVADPVQALDP